MCGDVGLQCNYCFRYLENSPKFFSSYILHIIGDQENDTPLPIFCDESCMLRWAAIKKDMPVHVVVKDFDNYRRIR